MAELRQPSLPILSRLYHFAKITSVKALVKVPRWYGDLRHGRAVKADVKKYYPCRPGLHCHIFFPRSYDRASGRPLPTLFNIHGGGGCLGEPRDDDAWNRRFADAHGVLVVGLNYRKAPRHPFPTAAQDVEALMLAAHDDPELPIDRGEMGEKGEKGKGKGEKGKGASSSSSSPPGRVAVGGFSVGGNLALSVCQLASIRSRVRPSAAVPMYPVLDNGPFTRARATSRPYKPRSGLPSAAQRSTVDFLAPLADTFRWCYVPADQRFADPLLSPCHAPRAALPRGVFLVGAERAQLAHEAWRMACRLAGRPVPALDDRVGRDEPAAPGTVLVGPDEDGDERFAFAHDSDNADADGGGDGDGGGRRSVRWLLVPDEIHGFDHMSARAHGSEERLAEALRRRDAVQDQVAEWLHNVVWKT